MTIDEQFLVEVYTQTKARTEKTVNYIEIGQKLGLSPRKMQNVLFGLLKANFIKRAEGDDIYLTPHGEKLALSLIK